VPGAPAAAPSQTLLPTASSTASPTSTPSLTPTATATVTLTPSPSDTSSPTISSTPTRLACWSQGGQIVLGKLETSLLSQPLEYRVYLPPCYARLPGRRYPVLYLIHGQSYTDDQWDRLGADETADRLIAAGEIAPFIIVMPRDRAWTQADVDPFGQAFLEVLLPYIDETFPTLAQRQYRAVGGLSRGASWAIHFGLGHWELFGTIGLHSPPVFWSDVPDVKKWLDTIPFDSMPRIFMDMGKDDRPEIKESALWFESQLTQRSIPHEWHQFEGYHEEAYWQAHVEQYLRWYAADWPLK